MCVCVCISIYICLYIYISIRACVHIYIQYTVYIYGAPSSLGLPVNEKNIISSPSQQISEANKRATTEFNRKKKKKEKNPLQQHLQWILTPDILKYSPSCSSQRSNNHSCPFKTRLAIPLFSHISTSENRGLLYDHSLVRII